LKNLLAVLEAKQARLKKKRKHAYEYRATDIEIILEQVDSGESLAKAFKVVGVDKVEGEQEKAPVF